MHLAVAPRAQVLAEDEGGHACWRVVETPETLPGKPPCPIRFRVLCVCFRG